MKKPKNNIINEGVTKIFLLQQEQFDEIRKALERNTEAIYQLHKMIRICLEKK